MYKFWDVLESHDIVKETRKIGGTTLYKVNLDSGIVKLLESLSREVADQINEKIIAEEVRENFKQARLP